MSLAAAAGIVGLGLLVRAALRGTPKRSAPKRKASTPKKRKPTPKHVTDRNLEKRVCKALNRRHIGGSGKPDCEGQVEVKGYRTRKVTSHGVRAEARKGRKTIVSPFTGFTGGAKREAKRRAVRLSKLRFSR